MGVRGPGFLNFLQDNEIFESHNAAGWPNRIYGKAWICFWCSAEWGGLEWWGGYMKQAKI